jgi:cellulose synthase/poly-beta-1,6-N-acetylglucosamine synthase-like glycosyltransferase
MWMDQTRCQLEPLNHSPWSEIAIAIPARNEEDNIISCLAALDRACGLVDNVRVTLVVSVNNSADRTAVIARHFAAAHAAVVVEEINLAPCDSHAGGARRRAMEQAATIAGDDGVILTSDADSEVAPEWILANLTELSKGVDAVAGTVAFKPKDRLQLMPMLISRRRSQPSSIRSLTIHGPIICGNGVPALP